jgi:hypothetical protein
MKIVRLVTVNLLVLFCLLLVIEFVLEKTGATDRDYQTLTRVIRLREFNLPNTTSRMMVGPDILKSAENIELKDYVATTDSAGFIQSATMVENPSHRIVFLGGSTTECKLVDDSLRFPSLVGTLFQKSGKAVNTFNSGVSGNYTLHSLNLLVNKVIHGNFQVAVMMHNINDLTHLSYNSSYYKEDNSPSRRNIVTTIAPEISTHDLGFFRQFGWGFRAKKSFQVLFPALYDRLFLFRRITLNDVPQHEFHSVIPRKMKAGELLPFKKNLKTFIAICRANEITPVLMTQFNRMTEQELTSNPIFKVYAEKIKASPISFEEYCGYYRWMNDAIREVAKQENVLLIDLDREVPKTKEYLYDLVHLNNDGSRLVAGIVYRELSASLFLR